MKKEVPPTVPPTPPKEDSVIPSQADIFRSIAEQLGITKAMDTAKGGTPLNAIINYVQRTGLLNKVPFRAVDLHNRQRSCFCHVGRGYRQEAKNVHPLLAMELSNESPHSKLVGGRPAEVDECIGMTALNAGRMLQELRTSKLAERTGKKNHLHQTAQRGPN